MGQGHRLPTVGKVAQGGLMGRVSAYQGRWACRPVARQKVGPQDAEVIHREGLDGQVRRCLPGLAVSGGGGVNGSAQDGGLKISNAGHWASAAGGPG